MRALVAAIQAIVSLALVGLLMPIVLETAPEVRESRVGSVILLVALAVTFVVIRLLWPGPRRNPRVTRS
jgi:hypothetical protein